MTRRFVHLGINPVGAAAHLQWARPPANANATLEAYLTQLGADWYRYASQNYVVLTDQDLAALANGITSLPGFQNMYVLAVNFHSIDAVYCNGMMPQQFWNWLHKAR